jgi:hypothetical protein
VVFNTVSGHRDAKPTSCPGLRLYGRLPAIRSRAVATASIVAASPLGHVDRWRQSPEGFAITGWTADRSSPLSPLALHLYVDGVAHTFVHADLPRPDVGAAYPAFGDDHGYDFTVRLGGGVHHLCLYAINVGGGRNSRLGCEVVRIVDSPIGRIDRVYVDPAGVHVSGWALDPDTAEPVVVRVAADGATSTIVASAPRPDVGARFPDYGSSHGFEALIDTPPTRLCIDLTNLGPGTDSSLGCPTVDSNPFGHIDRLARAPGGPDATVRLSGWLIDPNTTAPIDVHVSVAGAGTAHPAAIMRPDVASAYPVWGPRHGFDVSVAAGEGRRSICVNGVNVGPGRSTVLGCRTVVIGHDPVGYVDLVHGVGGQRRAVGWALDPDTAQPVPVHFHVGSRTSAAMADRARPDLMSRYPYHGSRHGFDAAVPSGGPVCAYAINSGPGSHALLGCWTG